MYTLDTNAVIYHLKDEPAVVQVLRPLFSQDMPVYVSAITELELLSYPALTEEDETRIETMLATVRIMPVTSSIARIAGGCIGKKGATYAAFFWSVTNV